METVWGGGIQVGLIKQSQKYIVSSLQTKQYQELTTVLRTVIGISSSQYSTGTYSQNRWY